MRVLPPGQRLHRQQRARRGDKEHRVDPRLWHKKSLKLAKKMAKLQHKLSEYRAVQGGPAAACSSSRDSSPGLPRCRSRSRGRRSRSGSRRRTCRRHRGRGKRFASHGGSSSSSSSSSSSGTSADRTCSGSDSAESCEVISSSRSSPSPPPPSQRGHRRQRRHRREARRSHREDLQTCIYKLLSRSELVNGFDDDDPEDREPASHDGPPESTAETLVEEDSAPGDVAEELQDRWKRLILEGSSDVQTAALLKKYAVSENRLRILKAPKLNPEIVPVATGAAIRNDCLLSRKQDQMGSGLCALSQAIDLLNNCSSAGSTEHSGEEVRRSELGMTEALEKLNDAADILLNAHRDLSEARTLIMLPELKRGAKRFVENCKPDDFLFGREFGEKVRDAWYFKRIKKHAKDRKSESKHESATGRKRKLAHQEGRRRTPKRLDLSGLSIKSS